MKDKTADLPGDMGIRALFVCMNEDYIGGLVNTVLNSLDRASPQSKRNFQNELDRLNLRIPGFRSASAAPTSLLREPVLRNLTHSDKLAAATLKIWTESHQPLREAAQERIEDIGTYIGVSTVTTDTPDSKIGGPWPNEAWTRETERLAKLHDGYDEDDIALMMCCVSGRLPGMADPGARSETDRPIPDILELLEQCADELGTLPPSSPEWEDHIPEFAERMAGIISAKQEERSRAATLDSLIAILMDDFSAEIAYLESDLASWEAASLPGDGAIASALGMCEELRLALDEYRAARESPPATTRSEEMERRKKNDELEDTALALLDRVGNLMSGEPAPEDDPPAKPARAQKRADDASTQAEPPAPEPDSPAPASRRLETFPDFDMDQLARENDSLKAQVDKRTRENQDLRSQIQKLESANESLRSEKRTLTNDVQFLQADKADIERSVETLQSKLTATEDDVEIWRLAYEDEARIPRMTVKDAPMHIANVSDAVKRAEDMFPDKLQLKTNSKSDIRDNPFEKPGDVWEALKWLATEYHDAKAGISGVPDFDLAIRQACGWQYKSDQRETTRNKYRDWYTTKTNGKTYWLLEHIGTGSSKDARHTIRIAFDWDKDERKVIVGYIGQHQRTDAT